MGRDPLTAQVRALKQQLALLELTVTHLYETLELQCTVNEATDQRLSSLYKLVLLMSGQSEERPSPLAPPEIIH